LQRPCQDKDGVLTIHFIDIINFFLKTQDLIFAVSSKEKGLRQGFDNLNGRRIAESRKGQGRELREWGEAETGPSSPRQRVYLLDGDQSRHHFIRGRDHL
jgi:hypothetical protein